MIFFVILLLLEIDNFKNKFEKLQFFIKISKLSKTKNKTFLT